MLHQNNRFQRSEEVDLWRLIIICYKSRRMLEDETASSVFFFFIFVSLPGIRLKACSSCAILHPLGHPAYLRVIIYTFFESLRLAILHTQSFLSLFFISSKYGYDDTIPFTFSLPSPVFLHSLAHCCSIFVKLTRVFTFYPIHLYCF